MHPLRRLTLAGAAVLVWTAVVPAQQAVAPRPLAVTVLPYLGDPALRAELKVTPEQATRLSDHQAKWLDELLRAPRDGERWAQLVRDHDQALAAILQPDQLRRLKQVGLQLVERRFGPARLLSYPDVVADLKLTAEQKAALDRAGARLDAVLTADQQARWKELTGAPFDTRLRPAIGGAVGGGVAGPGGQGVGGFAPSRMPTSLTLVLQKAVQDELKLTPDQVAKLADVRQQWAATGQREAGRFRRGGDPVAEKAVDDGIAVVLRPAQAQRLQQLVLQQQRQTLGDVAFFNSPNVVRALSLSADQLQKMRAAEQAERAALRAIVLSGEPYEQVAARVEARKKETRTQILAVLDGAQRGKLNEMLGEAFAGLNPNAPFAAGESGQAFAPAALFEIGTLTTATAAARYVTDKAVQKELNLTDEQVDRIVGLVSNRGRPSQPPLTAILRPEQFRRLNQIVLQERQHRYGPIYLLRFQDLAAALQLTDDQKAKLRPLLEESVRQGFARAAEPSSRDAVTKRNQEGLDKLGALLSPDQMRTFQEHLGAPYPGDLTALERISTTTQPPGGLGTFDRGDRGPGGRFTPAAPTPFRYLQAPDVRRELNLRPEQIAKVEEAERKRQELLKDYARLDRTQQSQKRNESVEIVNKVIGEVLTEAQRQRLREIELQQRVENERGSGAGASVLLAADVAQTLGLDVNQLRQIRAILQDAARTRSLITREFGLRRGGAADDGIPIAEFNRLTDDKVFQLLTAEQQAKWKRMLGEPFRGRATVSRFGGDRQP